MINIYLERYGYLWFVLPFIALPLIDKGVSKLSTFTFVITILYCLKYRANISQEIRKTTFIPITLAFLAPVIISLLDSLSPDLTIKTIWRIIRFSSYGILAIIIFKTADAKNRFMTTMFWLLILYCLDAVIQWAFDYNIYGYNPISNAWHDRVRGVFGNRYDLSFFLATLSPIIFYVLLKKIQDENKFYLYFSPLFIFLLIFTILIGGARTAVISLVISASCFFGYYLFHKRLFTHYKLIIGALFLIAFIIFIASQTDIVATRIAYSINAKSLASLTSNRTNLWYVAWSEFPNYWINGVGVRGFDALYQTYPDSYKIFAFMNHPHLQGLEVLIETGIIGFIIYIGLCLYLIFQFFKAKTMNPWMLIAFLTMMPINSYSGLYESLWLPIVCISLSLSVAFTPTQRAIN